MESNGQETAHEFDIAIIGLAGRFPKSRCVEDFWNNLCAGNECISFFSTEELEAAGADPSVVSRPDTVRAAALLDGIDLFDAAFFGYSRGEAEILDPQHRLFLETAWEALENAGYVPAGYDGRIGVYAGCAFSSYLLRTLTNGSSRTPSEALQLTLGTDKDYLPSRVSYKLNLRGPSVGVQTACSTSLAAVHLACQALVEDECDMALAGGVSILCPQRMMYRYQEGSILSPDGHCRAFDAKAQGTVAGNGIGVVVLKRYAEAQRNNDHIYAVIRGSAMNNDGSNKVGFTAPSVSGQAAVIRQALATADVEPATISYIETHGTGTHLGDSIEIAALKQVFPSKRESGPCILGAVKTNVGHLDTAAGIAGLIKTALALKHKIIPPTLHFAASNPAANLEESPFRITTAVEPWQAIGVPRRAGVSSFGIGGTNVHVVLEEAPEPARAPASDGRCLITLSAKNDAALSELVSNLKGYLQSHSDLDLVDVAYTTHVGREAFPYRRALIPSSREEAIRLLEELETFPSPEIAPALTKPSVVFMFPGQGAQRAQMAAEIYRAVPLFRSLVDRCAELLQPHLGLDLRTVLYPAPHAQETSESQLEQTALTQPALFVIEYALARLWMEWGVHPAAMIGHSIGEFVAACLAEVFSLEDALAIVSERGKLMQEMPTGSMLAVSLAQEALPVLPSSISVAALNAPELLVLSGPQQEIRAIQSQLQASRVTCRLLRTSHAYHSQMMEPAMLRFMKKVQQVALDEPKLPYISCVTGDWIKVEDAISPTYWAEQMRRTVRFSDGMQTVASLPGCNLLEVGPGSALCRIARQHRWAGSISSPLTSLGEGNKRTSDHHALLSSLGELWRRGVKINWKSFHAGERCSRVPLPAYPFQRERFWYDDSPAITAKENVLPLHLTSAASQGKYFLPVWKSSAPARLAPRTKMADEHGTCLLVLPDEFGLASRLAAELQKHSRRVITAAAGGGFEQLEENRFVIDPSRREDYKRLFQTLRSRDVFPHTIVHFGTITTDAPEQLYLPDDTKRTLESGFYSLLHLTAVLSDLSIQPIRLFVLSNHVHSVNNQEPLQPVKATVLGVCRVAPQEIPGLSCRAVDVAVPQTSDDLQSLAQILLEEISHESKSDVIAYRDGRRWEQAFESISLPAVSASQDFFRERGVYLITGGLGSLSFELSRLFATRYKARLVLVGRRPFPARQDWDKWKRHHGEDDPIAIKLHKIEALEKQGAEVLVFGADVTSLEQMEGVVREVNRVFGNIQGALHLAGIPGDGLIQAKTPDKAAQVLAPKLQGTLILDQVLRKQDLDFKVLFSSTLSVAGTVGQSDYSAANAFLDAFAHAAREYSSTPCVTVNWDVWKTDGWQAGLQEKLPEVYRAMQEARSKFGIGTEEGFEILQQLIYAAQPQIVVSKGDFLARLARSRAGYQPLPPSSRKPLGTGDATQSYRTRVPYAAPRGETERKVARIWEEVLRIPQVGVNDDFVELGGHSLFAIQIAARIREEFQIDIEMRQMLELPTIAEVAELIEKIRSESHDLEAMKLLDEITGLSPEEVKARILVMQNPPPD